MLLARMSAPRNFGCPRANPMSKAPFGGGLIRLMRRLPVWPYLLLTLPMFVVALILRAVTHSNLPYYIWAALWAVPLLIVLAARWLFRRHPGLGDPDRDRAGRAQSVRTTPLGPIDIRWTGLPFRHSGAERSEEPGTQGHMRAVGCP